MLLNVKELAAKGNPVSLHETIDMTGRLNSRADLVECGLLEAQLQAQCRDGLTEVTGTLRIPLKLACSRCLNETAETLTIPFRETFVQRASDVPQEDAEDTHVVAVDKVDLTPFVEETVWLALPYVPLCRDDCKGLCPVCGTNRNERDCGCPRERIDPRLAGLADFFEPS